MAYETYKMKFELASVYLSNTLRLYQKDLEGPIYFLSVSRDNNVATAKINFIYLLNKSMGITCL